MPTEDKLLERLDRAVRASRVAETIERTTLELGALLTKDQRARLAWRTVPLNVYGHLPDEIASSWVFVLRANSTSGAERHPNSIQRVMSYSALLTCRRGMVELGNRIACQAASTSR